MGTNSNQTEVLNLTDMPKMDNLQAITEGCNSVLISHSIEDLSLGGAPKVRKIVVFYDDGFCPFIIEDRVSKIVMSHGHSLIKSVYLIYKLGSWVHSTIQFAAILFKNILGVEPDNENILDFRGRKNKYKNEGGNRQ